MSRASNLAANTLGIQKTFLLFVFTVTLHKP